MTKSTPTRCGRLASVLLTVGFLAAPLVRSGEPPRQDPPAKSDKGAKRDEENLKKYDHNNNGKLDPDEQAEMRADQEKAKAEKKKKKQGDGR